MYKTDHEGCDSDYGKGKRTERKAVITKLKIGNNRDREMVHSYDDEQNTAYNTEWNKHLLRLLGFLRGV